jgi:tripartite-type tricarboxylate transporter receptor subunit TctC
MTFRVRICRSALLLCIVLASVLGASSAAYAEFSLQGKTVKLYAGSRPGGGITNFGQTLLPFLSKHLPGNPTIVVYNLVGGGGVKATQQLYTSASREGTVPS